VERGHRRPGHAIPNGLTVEYMPWLMRLFEEVPRPVNGELAMPTAPGLGQDAGSACDTFNHW
jgi:L-alanine-DL-glutamate epimerase-like enolase superfamily enzyme